jgi:beta-galactosidase
MTEFRDGVGGAGPAALRRRQFLRAAAAGGGGVVGDRLLAAPGAVTAPPSAPAHPVRHRVAVRPGCGRQQPARFDDSGLQAVTLPHTVTRLSWREWNPASWERVWVYRKHFDAPWPTGHAVHAQ